MREMLNSGSSLYFKTLPWVSVVLTLGCTAQAPRPDVTIPLRNPTAQVASQADVTPSRLAGDWIVVEGAGIAAGTAVSFSATQVQIGAQVLAFDMTGPGRFSLAGQDIWVHWLDISDRTAAMGDPAGGRVWILDRSGTPGERLKAAREILEWYGYDLSRIR